MKASTTCHQFPLLTDKLLGFHIDYLSGLLLLGVEDSCPLTSITEHCDSLQSCFPCREVYIPYLLSVEVFGKVDGGTDGSINVFLPYCLHPDTIDVRNILCTDKASRSSLFPCVLNDFRTHRVCFLSPL